MHEPQSAVLLETQGNQHGVERRHDRKNSRYPSNQRKSLLDSMSNHIANSVNCEPEISNRAISTTVPTLTSLPAMR